METESDYRLSDEEMENFKNILNNTWAYLHDILEKNEPMDMPSTSEKLIYVNRLLKWVDAGMEITENDLQN